MSADPLKDLALDEEYRAIEYAIAESPYRDLIELKPKLACRITDFVRVLNNEKPDILHFSGHGTGKKGLVFNNPHSETKINMNEGEMIGVDVVKAEHLQKLFATAQENLKLVFLNACLSEEQAKEISKEIDFVIGMSDFIVDGTAIILAEQFYNSFASNQSIKNSFDQASLIVSIQRPDEEDTPQMIMRDESVEDIRISEMIPKQEKEESRESESGTTINIKGDITGVGIVSGGTVNQTINKKTVNAKTNIEKIDNKDGGVINFS
jgi:hypothetical protein